MDLPNANALATLPEADIRQYFNSWVQEERENGLVDIKFALAGFGDGTVLDVMRQLLCIQAMKGTSHLTPFHD